MAHGAAASHACVALLLCHWWCGAAWCHARAGHDIRARCGQGHGTPTWPVPAADLPRSRCMPRCMCTALSFPAATRPGQGALHVPAVLLLPHGSCPRPRRAHARAAVPVVLAQLRHTAQQPLHRLQLTGRVTVHGTERRHPLARTCRRHGMVTTASTACVHTAASALSDGHKPHSAFLPRRALLNR